MNHPANRIEIQVPEKMLPLFTTRKRYVDIYGGRGSAKSWSVADFLLVKGMENKIRILCCREIQNSIRDSVHKLLCDRIDFFKIGAYYDIQKDRITGTNATEFIFKGLRNNDQDIKSTEAINYCWVEEAQSVSRKSLETLIPTIRNDSSQIIFTYNPLTDIDPVHADYTLADRDDTLKININWRDNPWFPEVLKADLEYDKKTHINKYLHIWEGQCVAYENDQVGAFETAAEWRAQYAVAFVDPSFSDRAGTDSTAVALVGVQDEILVFTGMLWPRSISNQETRRELLDFLNQYTPIETVLESQLSDSSVFFLDVLKKEELCYPIRNLWTIKHQSRGKHERIMATVGVQKANMRILEGTQQEFSLEVSRYRKDIDHDDAPDALAGAIETLATSDIIAEYAAAVKTLKR